MARIFFCDTNILRYVLDTPGAPARFSARVRQKGLVHAISLIQLAELLKLPRYHSQLVQLIFDVGTCLFEWWKTIVQAEALAYPEPAPIDVLIQPNISSQYRSGGPDTLRFALVGKDLELIWAEFEDQKVRYKPVMDWLPSTRPKSVSKHAIDTDFTLHNYGMVLQILRDIAPGLVNTIKRDPQFFTPTYFRGAYLHAAYDYYRYVLKGMRSEPSDIMDIHQVFYIPYCATVILEKSMAGVLSQLKRERSMLGTVEIKSIRYARSLFGPESGSS